MLLGNLITSNFGQCRLQNNCMQNEKQENETHHLHLQVIHKIKLQMQQI